MSEYKHFILGENYLQKSILRREVKNAASQQNYKYGSALGSSILDDDYDDFFIEY
tara:strand:- start:57 stop:221 length:165 start_codon:yes stop_codon:yes gene_type:complete